MAVFRVEKNSGYTVMSNHHLRNRALSLKAKGLLSQMLSLPEDWDYTLQGLARINRESIDAIRQAIRELEQAGYIQRSRERDEKGRLRGADYVIFELPQPIPASVSPTLENPTLENPTQENPTLENPMQLNKDKLITEKQKKEGLNTDSIPIHSPNPLPLDEDEAAAPPPERTGSRKETAYQIYRDLILENIEYDTLTQNPKGLIMLIPVAILLIVAFIKRNIYVACTWGLISGTIIGLVSGILVPSDIMGMQDGTLGGFLIDGVNNMIGTVGYLYAIAGIIGILSASGLLQQVIDGLVHSKLNRSVVGTEVIISVGLMVSSICLGSANGPAIIMWGPIANDLGESKGLHPYRRANLMDGFGSTLPAVIPVTSAFIFIALSCIQGLMDTYSFVQEVSPVSLAGASLHCWFLFVVLAVAVITGWGRKYEGPNGEPVKALPAQTK